MPLLTLNLTCENVKYPVRRHFEKTNTSNLRQALMLPRSKIHSISNDKASLVHKADILVHEYSGGFYDVF